MPKALARRKPLPVRYRMWRAKGEPRYEYLHADRWTPVASLSEAREKAASLVYDGIAVTPV